MALALAASLLEQTRGLLPCGLDVALKRLLVIVDDLLHAVDDNRLKVVDVDDVAHLLPTFSVNVSRSVSVLESTALSTV